MNLNGAEYYYVRNAQGDIIGLINAQGEKVVSYTYDSWGELISIEGSLKDTVGEKNPYRYRGYRYDSETGLYYLQNRYYNPEWGRFANADVIIGETGELLGHNLFAYSKNNWANMSDYSGFRPVYTLGEETEAMRAASYAVMNRVTRNRWRGSTSSKPVVENLKNVGKMVAINTINGGMDKVASTVTARYISTGLKYVESGILTIGTYVEKNPIGSLIKTATGKIGVSSFIGIGISAYSNIKKHGWTWGAAGRISIDSIFIVGAVAATVLIPGVGFAAAMAIGVAAEGGSRAAKNIIYGDKFWD